MAVSPRKPTRPRSAGVRRGVLTWLFALAIALQAQLLESNVRCLWTDEAPVLTAFSNAASLAPENDKDTPAPTDTDDCFICRLIATAGAVVLPAAPPLLFALASETIDPEAPDNLAIDSGLSHHWLSRGPPLVA